MNLHLTVRWIIHFIQTFCEYLPKDKMANLDTGDIRIFLLCFVKVKIQCYFVSGKQKQQWEVDGNLSLFVYIIKFILLRRECVHTRLRNRIPPRFPADHRYRKCSRQIVPMSRARDLWCHTHPYTWPAKMHTTKCMKIRQSSRKVYIMKMIGYDIVDNVEEENSCSLIRIYWVIH